MQQNQSKKKEGLNRVESEEEVHIYELEQGVILGQDDEDDEAMKHYVFKFNKLCVFAGYQRSNEGRQRFEAIMQKEEEEDGMALSHREELVKEFNSTSLGSKENQHRDEEQSKDLEQGNVLKDSEGVIKGNQQLEKKIEAIQEKEGLIQCDFVETIHNSIFVLE